MKTGMSCYLGVVLALTSVAAQADSTRISLGTYLSSGDYGTSTDTDMRTLSLSVRHKTGRWTLKASTAYLHITGDGNVLPDGETTDVSTSRQTRSGIGDLNLTIGNLFYYDKESKFGVTARGKVKVPTADEDKSLGTGELDYTFELAPFRKIGANTFFGAIGYKLYGDTPTTNYRNVWLAKAGFMHQLNPRNAMGLIGNFRQKTRSTREHKRNLMAFHTFKIDDSKRLQTYLITGLSDSTADIAGGLTLMYDF